MDNQTGKRWRGVRRTYEGTRGGLCQAKLKWQRACVRPKLESTFYQLFTWYRPTVYPLRLRTTCFALQLRPSPARCPSQSTAIVVNSWTMWECTRSSKASATIIMDFEIGNIFITCWESIFRAWFVISIKCLDSFPKSVLGSLLWDFGIGVLRMDALPDITWHH